MVRRVFSPRGSGRAGAPVRGPMRVNPRRFLVPLSLSIALAARPLGAQVVDEHPKIPDTIEAPADTSSEAHLGKVYAGGVLLGLTGFFAGGLTGYFVSRGGCAGEDYCGLEGFLIGAAVGGTLGMGYGVHLGNGRRGSLPLVLLTGAGIWGVGIGAAALSGWDDPLTGIVAIGVPIVQLLGTVAVERATGRAKERKRALSLYAAPDFAGGVLIGANLRF